MFLSGTLSDCVTSKSALYSTGTAPSATKCSVNATTDQCLAAVTWGDKVVTMAGHSYTLATGYTTAVTTTSYTITKGVTTTNYIYSDWYSGTMRTSWSLYYIDGNSSGYSTITINSNGTTYSTSFNWNTSVSTVLNWLNSYGITAQ